MTTPIPKVVYQTWKTKALPPEVEGIRNRMIRDNPEYTFVLYDDEEMDQWIYNHTDDTIKACYSQLAVGAAKADLWRYLVVHSNGGVYLDIDSSFECPIKNIIFDNDEGVVSRENNAGYFLQWMFAFKRGHPVLKLTIDTAIQNIQAKKETNIAMLTGPAPFTNSINTYYLEYLPVYRHMWYQPDDEINPYTNSETVKHRCRFNGHDYQQLLCWKSAAAGALYTADSPHWVSVPRIFKEAPAAKGSEKQSFP